jgi:hypothetical protein
LRPSLYVGGAATVSKTLPLYDAPMLTVFDNRELAILFWMAALVVFAIVNKSIRPSVAAVIDALFQPTLLTISSSWLYTRAS